MAGGIAVTGANRGIGAGIAIELARRGYRVGCLTRSGEGPDTPAELAGLISAHVCEVTDGQSVRSALNAFAEEAGGLAGLVNNAGIHLQGPSERFPVEDFARVLRVNTLAVFAVCQTAHPLLVANGGGCIVNIGSYWDRLGAKHNTAYAASKAAVGAITRCLAVEWAEQNIWVYNVAPGYIETDMNREVLLHPRFRSWLEKRIPVGRPGSVGEVARLVGALFSEDLPFLTGETIFMDGAQGVNQ